MADSPVVTRFAPSPTGALHVGGARTALFNWAYARRNGGRFLLRLEDTDRARSTEESARSILEDLRWIGLDWDNDPPPRQSQRLPLYNEAIERLLKSGSAHDDGGAVRFRMPDHPITVRDVVLGDVTVAAGQVEDFVIRKSDGYPTYHYAVVVDDAEMGVTHVIRGQEHLNNATKHWALQEALGLPHPHFAHIPLIFNPDGSKMSKRDREKGLEVNVEDFRASGYLPEALCNYLALLGWNPGGDVEKFDNKFLVERFGFDRVGKANSKFDREKLFRFNADAIKALAPGRFVDIWRAYCQKYQPEFLAKLNPGALERLAAVYQERSRTLAEPCKLAAFFVLDDAQIVCDEKAVGKNLSKEDGLAILREYTERLRACPEPGFGNAAHELIRKMAEEKGIGMGKIAQPLRVAVSGNVVTPQIDATLDILGKGRTLTRIQRCLDRLDRAD